MEEDNELEEGEARYNKEEYNNIDIDSLSYIDEKIQHVLGHFQKDFEGGVSAENLGAKFGGYGSFLPTYERSCVPFHAKTLQRNYSSPISPKNLHTEAEPDNSKSSSNVAPSLCLTTAAGSVQQSHTLKAPTVDYSVKKDGGVSSSAVAERCLFKDHSKNKSGNSTDQRTLKFRIKMKSNMSTQKNAAIYSGLGLDNSPSLSMGNSPDENEGMPSLSRETAEESPTTIIQVMSSFPIPGGVLLSPLNETLLCLMRKEKFLGDRRSTSSLNISQEHCSVSANESDSFVGDGQLLNKRKVRIVGQSKKKLELKHKNGNGFEEEITLHTTRRFQNKTPDCKDFLPTGLKCTPLSSFCDAGEAAEVTGKVSEVSMEVNEDAVKGRMVFSEAVKEESLESISGQDFDRREKQHTRNSFSVEVSEHKLANSLKDNHIETMNNGKCKANMISRKTECDATKFKVHQGSHTRQTNQKGKPLLEGKNNSKGDHNSSKAGAVGGKDSSVAGNNVVITDKKRAAFGGTSCKSQMHETKSLNDDRERPCHRAISNVNHDNGEGRSAYRIKVKERQSVSKMADLAGPCIKDASNACPVAENKPASEMVPAIVPQLIAEDWVCCDNCQKWRLLPLGVKPEQLPEKWLCSMLNWLPGMNRCDISEEETTKAVSALNQMPTSERQNILQSHASGTAIGLISADALRLGMTYQKSSSDVMSGQGKKRQNSKEKAKAGVKGDVLMFPKSLETSAKQSGKNRALTDMNQCPSNSNPIKKSSYQHLIRLNKLKEKCMPEEKVKQVNRGDGKQIKLRRRIEADQTTSGTPKKAKTEDVYYSDRHLNPDMDQDVMGLKSRKCSPMKVSGKGVQKYDEYCLSGDAEDKLVVPVKKLEGHPQVLSNGVSVGEIDGSKKDISIKKRKLKDWMDTKKQNKLSSMQDGEEGIANGFRKEKKCGVLATQTTLDTEGDIEFDRKDGRSRICLSGSRDDTAVDIEVRNIGKAQQQRKRKIKVASQQALDYNDPLGRDLGSGQLSLAATSSSSMISGSHKARTNFEDVKVSPVASITSSPLRTSNLDKLIFTEGATSWKDAAEKGGLSSMSSKICRDNKEEKHSLKRKKKILNDSLPERHKISSIECLVEDGKAQVLAKTCEVGNAHLLSGGAHTIDHANCVNGTHQDDRVNKNNQKSAFSRQESGKATSLLVGKKDRRSDSEADRDKMKALASENGYTKNGGRYGIAVDLSYHEADPEARNDAKYNFPESKHGIDNINKKNPVRSWLSETGKKIELKPKDVESPVLKVDVPCTSKRNILSKQKPSQNFKKENKADCLCTESIDGKLKPLLSSVSEVKSDTVVVSSRTVPGSPKCDMSNGKPDHASCNGDLAKLIKSSADARSKVGVGCNFGNFAPDRSLNTSSPVRVNSNLTARITLDEATKLKDMADNFKNSGFEFESNETYFEAALRFLHGASLLENCHNESSKHGETSQMQLYATTAKLFKSCAHEYQRRQEMAAAALAFKCMEVTYMRLVYCKHCSANRMWHELQSTLNVVPQGESPSSTVSDVDNLINQAAVDKATLPRGTGSHLATNQAMPMRNRSTVFLLLDFTQDVNFAMEASRKCHSTFAAASILMEVAQNKECIDSIRRVIDFSFQDVDEIVRLVSVARKAITRAGLDGARD